MRNNSNGRQANRIPVLCPYCFGKAELVDGGKIYPHRRDLSNLKFWLCASCDAYVGCHKGTEIPLGRLANSELRRAKEAAHSVFDQLWMTQPDRRKARASAYRWLANALGISVSDCHIGAFDIEACNRVIEVCKNLKEE